MIGKLKSLMVKGESPALELIRGDEPGRLYRLDRARINIGRAEDNEIVLPIEGISRNHATIEAGQNGQWIIRDNGSKNGVLINGERVDRAVLNEGDTVQVGNVAFRFVASAIQEVSDSNEPGTLAPYVGEMDIGESAAKPARPPVNKRVLIYAGVAILLGGLYYMSMEEAPKTSEDKSSTPKVSDFKIDKEPELLVPGKETPGKALEDPSLTRAERETGKLDWKNDSLKEAELFYRRGQREYLNKNYSRAIELFQTTLSLNRTHVLADRYLRFSVYEAEVEAKKQYEMALKYFDSLQYQRAIYHFTQVISLMSHRPKEGIVGQSEKFIAASKRALQGAELFP